MTVLRIIPGDQLWLDLSALDHLDPDHDFVLMGEVMEENTYVGHHKQKTVLVLAAMQHFVATLRQRGLTVDYARLDAPEITSSLTTEVQRAVARHLPSRIMVTAPSEWRVAAMAESWESLTGTPVEIRSDHRFFASRARFAAWVSRRRGRRIEHFYREMRREHGLLMQGDQPAGGQWNYDGTNRKRFPANSTPPARQQFFLDETTRVVMALVEQRFTDYFGDLQEFGWPVTRPRKSFLLVVITIRHWKASRLRMRSPRSACLKSSPGV